jgi:galactose-1-phosphate uridylyltransferase
MRAAALCNEEAGWDGLIRHPVRQNSLVPPF